jgi:tRNA 2-thiocytidine biosynthesis protein TtcA
MDKIQQKRAYWLLKDVNKAIRQYKMISHGDKIAVAVSGGKDSLTLLKLLDLRRKSVKENYELSVIHVIGDSRGSEISPHSPLVQWLENNPYDYVIVPLNIPEDEPLPLNCSRCTWNRRKTIFEAAQKLNCNVIAFGHHADDLAQTTLMNLLYHGRIETIFPIQEYFDGTFRLIRPLCLVPEKEIMRFARVCDFPLPPPACPNSEKSHRKFIGDLIDLAEKNCQDARVNLLRAGLQGLQV